MATTLGSNITNYPSFPLTVVRAGVDIVPVKVTFGGAAVSLVSCPVACSVASSANGIFTVTVPSGLQIELMGMPVPWTGSAVSAVNWVPSNMSLGSGTFSLIRRQENVSGTLVTGVAPASGEQVTFFL